MYLKKVPTSERMPEIGKWVTAIDQDGQSTYCSKAKVGWTIQDGAPVPPKEFTHWLEDVGKIEVTTPKIACGLHFHIQFNEQAKSNEDINQIVNDCLLRVIRNLKDIT